MKINRRNRLLLWFVLNSGLVGLVSGCNRESPAIRQIRVEKSRSDLGDLGKVRLSSNSAHSSGHSATSSSPTRMVVAIADRPEATWFFKITGPVDAVTETERQWETLLSSVHFDTQGNPIWDETEDWERQPERPMRFATLTAVDSQGDKVELAISSLGPGQDKLSNVNRWRGQLALPPIAGDQLTLIELESPGGRMFLFDETGASFSDSMVLAPMHKPMILQPTFAVPAGWKSGTPSAIVRVRLSKGDQESSPKITVTQLFASANQWLPNARRWANEVEMDDSQEFIDRQSTEIIIDQSAGQKIRLIPDDVSKSNGLIGAMVVRDELAWFFKLVGGREQVLASEKDFDTFLDSFRFN